MAEQDYFDKNMVKNEKCIDLAISNHESLANEMWDVLKNRREKNQPPKWKISKRSVFQGLENQFELDMSRCEISADKPFTKNESWRKEKKNIYNHFYEVRNIKFKIT